MPETQVELVFKLEEMRRDWITEAMILFDGLDTLDEFTSDDLYAILPPPQHPNWMGALLAKLLKAERIHEIGRTRSRRAAANGRKISIWKVNRHEA